MTEKKTESNHIDQRTEYWASLNDARNQVIASYGKTVMAFSGGGLGLTLTFMSDLLEKAKLETIQYMLWAWVCWTASCAASLMAIYFAILSASHAMKRLRQDKSLHALTGGPWAPLVIVLSPLSGILFIVGAIFAIVFVNLNAGGLSNVGTQ